NLPQNAKPKCMTLKWQNNLVPVFNCSEDMKQRLRKLTEHLIEVMQSPKPLTIRLTEMSRSEFFATYNVHLQAGAGAQHLMMTVSIPPTCEGNTAIVEHYYNG